MTDNNQSTSSLDFYVGLFCGACITVAAAVVAMAWAVM